MEPSLILSEHDGELRKGGNNWIIHLILSIFIAAKELSKLPAKKRFASSVQQQQLSNSNPVVAPSSISIIPLQAHSTTSNSISSSNNNNNNSDEPMEEDEEEINVHDDDSPLDMRITKHDSDSDSVRPSVIRRAPSFKETNSNSPSGKWTLLRT